MNTFISCTDLLAGLKESKNLLLKNQTVLNELNFFPVADKDTGTNMAISFQKACDDIFAISSFTTPKQIFEELVAGMLMYGHGNSGTILTMFFDGFTCELPDTDLLSGSDIANAFFHGARTASEAVANPIEGTILSVSRDAADAALSIAEITDDTSVIWNRITSEAHSSLSQTSFKNPVLKDKHVCDSGAYGFCLLLDGLFSSFCSDATLPPYDTRFLTPSLSSEEEHEDILTYRYCTEFLLLLNESQDKLLLESDIKDMGDCFLMISRENTVKVHIHTNTPDELIAIASNYGDILSRKIDDMMH